MRSSPVLLHTLSPLHAGTGRAADIIDLPTARMKATGIPIVPGSFIKGCSATPAGPVTTLTPTGWMRQGGCRLRAIAGSRSGAARGSPGRG
jgi:hypothetical protein